MSSPSSLRDAWPALIGLYVCAVAVNLVGIRWGLPGQGRALLPSPATWQSTEAIDRSWGAIRDSRQNLNFGPPDPDQAETPAKAVRRFLLYTADPDEVVAMMAVARLNPLAGRWDPGFSQYGGFFLYALGATFKLTSAAGLVTIRSDPSFYLEHPEAMGRMFLAGRLLVVLVGALAIPLVWLIACPLYGPRGACLAAGLAAVTPAWIAWSHVMKPVAFGAPFALAALVCGDRLRGGSRPWRLSAASGLMTGLAAGAALQYGIMLLGPWIAIGLRRGDPAPRRLALAAVAAGAFGLTLVALHPYWLLAPARTAAGWSMVTGWYQPAYSPSALVAFAWGTLGPALGLPMVLLGVLEGGLRAWRREALPVVIPAFAMLVAAAVKTGGVPGDPLHARLVLPALLVLAMLAAGGLWRAGRALPRPVRALPGLLVIPSLLIAAGVLRNFVIAAGPTSARHLAGAWLNALPAETRIGIIGALAPFRSPYFRVDRYQFVAADAANPDPRADAPDYFLVAERSPLPTTPSFLSRYREIRRFATPRFPLGASADAVYPFADPPVTIYARGPTAR